MFSVTTMASSTTKPVEMVSAMSERLSMLKPARYMMPKVPMSETGTATAGMIMVRKSRRKTKTTRMTSTTAMTSVRSTSLIEARMVVVWSIIVVSLMPAGISACSVGIIALMWSTVVMMFAPGSRKMMRSTEGLPSAKPALRISATESVTCATSPTRTGAPLW
jgi:hypothetical protein